MQDDKRLAFLLSEFIEQHVLNFRQSPDEDYEKVAKCFVQYEARIRLLQKIHEDQLRKLRRLPQACQGVISHLFVCMSCAQTGCTCCTPVCVLHVGAFPKTLMAVDRGSSQDACADAIERLRRTGQDDVHTHPSPEAPVEEEDNAPTRLGDPPVSTADVPPEDAPISKPTSPARPVPNAAADQVPIAEVAASDPHSEVPAGPPKDSIMDSLVPEGQPKATDCLPAVGNEKALSKADTDGTEPATTGAATLPVARKDAAAGSNPTTTVPQSAPETDAAALATDCQPPLARPQTRGAASKACHMERATVLPDAAAAIQASCATKEAAETLSKLNENTVESSDRRPAKRLRSGAAAKPRPAPRGRATPEAVHECMQPKAYSRARRDRKPTVRFGE